MSSGTPISCLAVLEPSAPARGRGDWARLPAAVVLWVIAAGLLAAGAQVELRVFRALEWMWEVITWKGEGAPPGPVTLTFFFFPLMLIVAAVIAVIGIGSAVFLARAGRKLLCKDSRPSIVLLLGLALLLLPFGYAVVASVFFMSGRFAVPSARNWLAFINRDGLYVLAPAIFVFLCISLLCCIRPAEPPARP